MNEWMNEILYFSVKVLSLKKLIGDTIYINLHLNSKKKELYYIDK